MRRVLLVSGALGLVVLGCVFQACGGSEALTKDGGMDGNPVVPDDVVGPQPDVNMMTPDSGDMDVAPDVAMDAGPKCTNQPCVIGLAVGGHHACALIVDGTVRCWGRNQYGQLGSGGNDAGMLVDAATRSVPVAVDSISNATQVSASTVYTTIGATCARLSTGSVVCFGNNSAAQLGLSAMMGATDNNPHPLPTAVAGLPMSTMSGLANYMGCAVTSANEYWCWGDNDAFGQTSPGILGHGPNPSGPTEPRKATIDAGISAGSPGSYFNLALTQGGTVLSWGDNQNGSLGRNTNGNDDPVPAPVQNLSNAVQISAGMLHACAVTQGGQVLCWGDNAYGQLGRGIVGGSSDNPQSVPLPMGKMATQVACSNYHTCVTTSDGSVYCWGRNNAGQVGPNTPDGGGFNPQPVSQPQEVANLGGKALFVGTGGSNGFNFNTGYSCALIEGGSVSCWGYNGDSQLGRGNVNLPSCSMQFTLPCSPTPAPVVWQ
jgi:alpha-tubulin suppressor-like RCC1 family protein